MYLTHVRAGAEGFKHLHALPDLRALVLTGTNTLTNDDLAALAGLRIGTLQLSHCTNLSDAGMAHLAKLPALHTLVLLEVPITNAGAKKLSMCPTLESVQLKGSKVTKAGAEELAKALPWCHIDYTDGEIKPVPKPDTGLRKAVARALADGASAEIRIENQGHIAGGWPNRLPDGPFSVNRLDYTKAPLAFTDADLEPLRPFADLTVLEFGRTELTDAGLKHLAALPAAPKLTHLRLGSARVTDAGLGHLKALPLDTLELLACDRLTAAGFAHLAQVKLLRVLNLSRSSLTGAGLAALAPLADLEQLDVSQTSLVPADLKHLAGFKKLRALKLCGLPLTDGSLDEVAKLATLNTLDLRDTKVTKAGAEKLAAALPHCTIEHPDGAIKPQRKLNPAQRKALDALFELGASVNVQQGEKGNVLSRQTGVPQEPFRIVGIAIHATVRETPLTPAVLAPLKELPPDSFSLSLNGPGITDATLVALAEFPWVAGVIDLKLSMTDVTGTAFAKLPAFANLQSLRIDRAELLTGAGLMQLASARHLRIVSVTRSKVTKAEVEPLALHLLGSEVRLDGEVVRPVAPPANAPDARNALEWVLANGGTLVLVANQSNTTVGAGQKLPDGDFAVHSVSLTYDPRMKLTDAFVDDLRHLPAVSHRFALLNYPLTDAGLAKLGTIPGLADTLTQLDLRGTTITDNGLSSLDKFTKVHELSLALTGVTGAQFKRLLALPNLDNLNLHGTPVTGAALAELKGHKMSRLRLADCPKIDDAAMEHVLAIDGVKYLVLENTAVGDAGIATLARSNRWRTLALGRNVTDDGLKPLGACTNLDTLDVRSPKVTDAGLVHLTGLKTTAEINLVGTKVTKAGAEELAKALPKCRIVYPDGRIVPK